MNDNKTPISSPKWCNYHKVSTHADTECLVQQRKRNGEASTQTKKLNILVEPSSDISQLVVAATAHHQSFQALVDTGSSLNCISETLRTRLGLPLHEETVAYQYADGVTRQTLGTVELTFELKNYPQSVFTEKLNVLSDSPADVVLGHPFLRKHNAVINMSRKEIQLNNLKILLQHPTSGETIPTPDQILLNRVVPQNNECNANEEINKLLEPYICSNPSLGTLPGPEVRLPLQTNIPISVRPYPTPFKLRQAVRDEIQRLLELGIIRESRSKYACAAFPVPKKTEGVRLVVDYQPLNRITIKEGYPFPNVWDHIYG